MGVEGAERMGWGPILARKKRDFGYFLRFKESDFWHVSPNASCACYIAKANTSILNKKHSAHRSRFRVNQSIL